MCDHVYLFSLSVSDKCFIDEIGFRNFFDFFVEHQAQSDKSTFEELF